MSARPRCALGGQDVGRGRGERNVVAVTVAIGRNLGSAIEQRTEGDRGEWGWSSQGKAEDASGRAEELR